MQAAEPSKTNSAVRELIALLLASIACATVLTVGLAGQRPADLGGLQLSHLLVLGVFVATAAIAFGLVWVTARNAGRAVRQAREEATGLQRTLVMTEAIIRAEPQVLVHWEQGRGLDIVAHTLTSVPGLPVGKPDLLRFGSWLEPASAAELKTALDLLFSSGQPFSMMLKTAAGGHLEADGRAAGSRAVLRLRDVAAYKRDLVRILDQHRQISRDIGAFRALLDALPMPVWLRGADGKIEWVNRAYVSAVEASDAGEVCERQHELLESRQRTAVTGTLAKGEAFAKRLYLLVDGERRPHDVLALGGEQSHVAIAIDVTALERAQGELDRQMTAYDRTLDRVKTAVVIFDRQRQLTFCNDAYRKLWGLELAWLESKPSDGEVLDRLHELSRLPPMTDYRQWKSALLSNFASGQAYDDWWQLPDGRLVHVLAEPRHDGGMTYLFDDATERFEQESRVNAMIDVQRETLDSLKEGVAVFATDGRLKLFNTAFVAIWRISRETLEREPHIEEIIAQARISYDDMRTWDRLLRAVTAVTDERDPLEGQMLRPDMSVIDYASTPLPDGATLITFADVTDSKRYERALEERNEALVAADRLKSQFIGHVSYELRTPLTNIIGFTELLASPRTGAMTPKQREYLADIQASSTTLLSIIDDILDLASIDAGGLELKLAPVGTKAIIDAALLGVRERAMRTRLTFDIATAEEDITFIADEARVRQVLYKILSNAVGFSNPGDTVRISVWRESGLVAFMVEDKGVGIPKEQLTRVFDRFESHSQGSKHRGAGLGLSVVKSLVELHHGDMTLESEPGQGTRVTVRFPEDASRPPIAHAARAKA